jgi:hypothetical protein
LNTIHQGSLPMRLSRRHRLYLYVIGGSLAASGIAWLIAHYLLSNPSEFGETHHPSEPWWLRLHGAAVMAFLVLLGTILPGHVTRAWSLRRNRALPVRKNVVTGTLMLSLVTALALTGYGLYYCGDEELRPYISTGHWLVGLTAAASFYQHHRSGLRRARSRDSLKRIETVDRSRAIAEGPVLLNEAPQTKA